MFVLHRNARNFSYQSRNSHVHQLESGKEMLWWRVLREEKMNFSSNESCEPKRAIWF